MNDTTLIFSLFMLGLLGIFALGATLIEVFILYKERQFTKKQQNKVMTLQSSIRKGL